MAVTVASTGSLLPVLALEFSHLADAVILLAGEGPYLKVYSESRHLRARSEVLPCRRIHGICQAPPRIFRKRDEVLVLVFGQKSFRLLTICHTKDFESSICLLTGVIELSDWILDVCWLVYSDPDGFEVAALTAHNTVTVYAQSGATGSTKAVHRNEVNCILYSGCLVGNSLNDLVVASGTVFNQVLLWNLQELSTLGDGCHGDIKFRFKTRLTLVGHEGVIFSVRFSDDLTRIVSVSDDRTIRVWDLPHDWFTAARGMQRSCSLVLFGHTARIWDALILPQGIVSIGEDGTARVWDQEGRCVDVLEGHGGRSIWSLAVNKENNMVATGGSDCSIQLSQIVLHNSQDLKPGVSIPQREEPGKPDLPRSVLLCGEHILCLTSHGMLYSARTTDLAGSQWLSLDLGCDPSGYIVMALSPCGKMLALGNGEGFLMVASLSSLSAGRLASSHSWRAHHSKVFSVTWASSSYLSLLLTCGAEGELICWKVKLLSDGMFVVEEVANLLLPKCRHRWISCAVVVPDHLHTAHTPHTSTSFTSDSSAPCWIVCGDRRGSVLVYKASTLYDGTKMLEPVSSLYGCHGANGVTSLVYAGGQILSTGRDGFCRRLGLEQNGHLTELSAFKPMKGVEWIERVILAPDGDMLFLVFHATDLLLHSMKQNRPLLKLSCGGGHRSCGVSSDSELLKDKMVRITYIKGGLVYLREMNLSEVLCQPILQQPFVSKEAISLEVVDSCGDSGLIAVGSEECTVCILRVKVMPSESSISVRCLQSLQGHLSSVRALTSTPSDLRADHKLLFSGGGRASLKAWLLSVKDHDNPSAVLQSDLFLHEPRAHSRVKWRQRHKGVAFKADPECRVMSLTTFPLVGLYNACHRGLLAGKHYIAVACSDGIIRQYIYCEKDCDFVALHCLSFHKRCLLTVSHIIHRVPACCSSSQTAASDIILDAVVLLISTATDGKLVFWSLNHSLDVWFQLSLLNPSAEELMGSNWEDGKKTVDGHDDEQRGADAKVVLSLKVHQSGINDVAIIPVTSSAGVSCYRIATVGDDNCLSVLECCIDPPSGGCGPSEHLPSLVVSFQCSEPRAHSSSITGVQFLSPTTVLTTSIDQRLNMWELANKSLVFVWGMVHDIADTAALETLQTTHRGKIVVLCGIGFQCFQLLGALDTFTMPTNHIC